MVNLDSRLLRELKQIEPQTDESSLVALFAGNLDLNEPERKAKLLVAFSVDALRVYRDGVLQLEEPTEKIASVRILSGVGCAFGEYVRKTDGAPVLFVRGDGQYRPAMAASAKFINHYLKYGDTDFSKMTSPAGKMCPNCGKPYPRGSKTCPHCASKRRVLVRLLALAKQEWWAVAVAALLFLVTTLLSVIVPYINRIMVDDYIRNDSGNVLLWGFVGVILSLLAVNLLRRGVSILRGYFLTVAGNRLIVRLRNMVFEKIQKLSIAKISERTSGELMKRVSGDTHAIRQFLINQLPNLLEQSMVLLAVGGVMLWYDWRLTLMVLLPTPLVVLAFRFFWRFMRGMFHRRWELNSRAGAILHDIFSGIRVVKSYGMEKMEEERYLDISEQEKDAQLRQEKVWALLMPTLNFLMGFGEYVLLYYVGRQMLNGQMTAGEMTQFSAYAGMVYAPLNALMNFPRQFMSMMTSVTRVYEIMDESEDVPNGTANVTQAPKGNIDINHVSFGYEDAVEVLEDIDLHIRAGEFVGIVGRSGVGKSTLINLIMRMYDVAEGSIQLDGVDIRDIPQEVLRKRMGVVLQENFLFTGSVWQNIAYAKPNATYEEVIHAAKLAGAHSFIVRLPDGYNTYVGEKGYTLSGGERQRIAIARALLHNPQILILDEATASLDTETEKLIQDALQRLSAGRTTIAIAHRLSTLRNATRLVVLDRGKVAESGTHEELMERHGLYYELVMSQREMSKLPNL